MVIHEVINTPFQVAMDCKHVEENADHICWNCTIKIIDMAEQLEAERNEWRNAMQHLTPLGSEYLTPQECTAYIESKMGRDIPKRIIDAEAERDMYKQGFDALTTANEQIVKERDTAWSELREIRKEIEADQYESTADEVVRFANGLRRSLAQHVTTRAELLDTIEKLKAENEAQAKRIKELEDSDAHFSRAMSEALNEGDGVYRP